MPGSKQPSSPTGSPSRPAVRVITSPEVHLSATSAPVGSPSEKGTPRGQISSVLMEKPPGASSSSSPPKASGSGSDSNPNNTHKTSSTNYLVGAPSNRPAPSHLLASVTRTTSDLTEPTPTITGLTPTSGPKTTPPKTPSSPSGSDSSNGLSVVDNQWCVDRKQEIEDLRKKVKQLYSSKAKKDDVKTIQRDLQKFVRKLKETSSTGITSQTSTKLASLLKTAQDVSRDLYKIFKPIKNSNWRIPLIEYVEQIMRFAGSTFPLNTTLLVQFASTCQTQFVRWGILDHVDIAIANLSNVLHRFTNGDHLDISGALAALYGARYYQFGDPKDYTKAVEFGLEVCNLTAKSSPSWVSRNIELALVYLAKARRTDQTTPETIRDAIQCALGLLEPISPTPDDKGWIYLCETLAWKCHFVADNRDTLCKLRAQLTKASMLKSSVPSNQNPKAHEAARLAALGFSHLTLYEKEQKKSDLMIATQQYETATNSTAIDKQHPDRCSWLIGLGRAYNHANKREHAMRCFRDAALLTYAIPTKRMDACLKWAKVPGAELVQVYRNMLDIMPRLVGLEQTLPHRIENVKMVVDLAQKATRAAIEGNDLLLALEFAERGRGIFFQSAFKVRVLLFLPEFLELQNKHPTRARYLKQSVDNLRKSDHLLRFNTTEQQRRTHHRRGAKYANELGKVLPISNLGDPLRPTSKKLIQAATDRNVVIINDNIGTSLNIDALVIKEGSDKPEHVALRVSSLKYHLFRNNLMKSGLTRREGRPITWEGRQEQTPNAVLKEILVALWTDVVKPIIEHLGFTVINNISAVEKLPRITWCLTGELAFLPIHAAGDYNTPGSQERLFNYAMSSYTPTLRALFTPAPSSATKRQKIFIAAMEKTPDIPGSLGGTIEEKNSIAELAQQSNILYTTHLNDQATIQSVLAGLKDSTSVHLACHGIQDLTDPIQSRLALNDGDLTVEKLLQLELEPKDLAFLSACETAKGDARMPNEAIHLALIMMLLGFRAVIATLWAIIDADGPVVAEEFYRRVMKDGKIDLKRVAIALHMALHVLRSKIGEEKFSRWCGFVHIGV
ncbi:DNA double-strand break repair Rad50 ATPase [Ceratobasidium theobromae]|uniref:DNA double-strand break repair Rad50 ATPase n=1 Tax=Ceratobasidium theobromae TaxID=1582974 RepID=A0A5N5Q861_9AGAM|nr:DNA double-strand break repair Rad50 ATPase [Ceratobasidium theobromae]